MEVRLYKISAYLNKEELRQFMTWVRARGAGQSGYIREQLSFDVRPRGAPKGPRKKAQQPKRARPKEAKNKKEDRSSAAERKESQLSFLD